MNQPRYFVISGAASREEIHDRAERHGRILHSRLYDAEVCPEMVYGVIEIEPHEKEIGS